MDEKEEIKNSPVAKKGTVMQVPIARKKEIVRKMSSISGYRSDVCSATYDAFYKSVRELLFEDNHVYIRGLGMFILRMNRRRHIMLYGQSVEVRPLKKVYFEISLKLKRAISSGKVDESDDGEQELDD